MKKLIETLNRAMHEADEFCVDRVVCDNIKQEIQKAMNLCVVAQNKEVERQEARCGRPFAHISDYSRHSNE